ncbi:MAG: LysR family transcriptional regulator [Firmicutes bacterium]|nr:LysR family transcriptional regulator [Bacillota bacterium]
MTLLQFEVFKTVVETGSFTKAGEILNLTQSAVSHAISGLESQLKVSLLHRNRTGVTLTDAGEQLITHIREVLNHKQQIEQKAAKINGVEIGRIRIGSFLSASSELLPGMISEFKKSHPAIDIKIHEGGYNEIEGWITSGIVDIGFVILPNKEFDTVPLFKDEYVGLFTEGHPLRCKQCIDITEIADEPFIMPLAGCESLIKPLFNEKNIKPKIQFEVEHTTTIIAMVKAGLGISIVPSLAYKPAGVFTIELRPRIEREIGLAVRSLSSSSPATKAFIQMAQTWLQSKQSNCC